ncbi:MULTISPECIES: DNA circularization N-terminal domain-containing protein [unclassified Novosphingobium]|uniref:DNA circularization N-terminal domain-containing protein n=1 Tax=unclassified Novosphingobium TaxID=2644732 RepID=UPI00086EC383|nr:MULTISPECIES: DNA circularization N-terminal domain-containing protein [unclassified Novosphingobium]MBN9143759.1 DNA circularization N-terminal domain-containing protein [Novosphingobium sp.]ODU84369.1 MAG: hypothetical protein ABT10_03010 [Novosphingobium sp. SCN 63-17]OJX92909.1 MAG: hypothetical protein BGP00_23610 [Novosphingobium sp. 63-713]
MALAPAAFRGAKFAVVENQSAGGRRVVVHQYPGKEVSWAEDLGRDARRFRLHGFVLDGSVKLGGSSVSMQRAALLAACDKPGPGTLDHPTLGKITVALLRWTIGEGLDAENYSEVEIEAVETGQQEYPVASSAATTNLQKQVGDVQFIRPLTPAGSRLRKALISFAKSTVLALISGKPIGFSSLLASATGLLSVAGVRTDLVGRIAGWVSRVLWYANDATALYRIATGLIASSGSTYGRYALGANSGLIATNQSAYANDQTISGLTSDASVLRQEVKDRAAATSALAASVDLADITDLATAVTDMIDALLDCCADPADAIRILLSLIATTLSGGSTSITALVDLMVCQAAAAALTDAVSRYQPSSTDDAAARIAQIAPVLDKLAVQAADAGADDVHAALRDCRAAIVVMLRDAAATAADLREFAFGQPLPALLIAQQLYGDATRADQLVGQVNPIHPLFFPLTFEALAS